MPNPATIADVAARWRPLRPAETGVAQTLLNDAWVLLQRHDPTIPTRLGTVPPTLDAQLVVMVLCAMVLRVLKNPDGKTQESIEGTYSYTRNDAGSSGELLVTLDEQQLLAAPSIGRDSDAFTIRPYYEPTVVEEVW